jgi:hypothetical protein
MSYASRAPIAAFVLVAAVPLAWFACGGESKPPESAADQSSSATSSAEPAASESAAPAESASAAAEAPSAAPAESSPPAAPPPPLFGATDCGSCIDKTCTKQSTACGKDPACQTTIDSIHACTSGGAGCLDSATAPTGAKPKKLAAAYEACGKKAIAKACKAKCQ